MSAGQTRSPEVYRAIAAITSHFARHGIAKSRVNEQEGYRFRGIDDVYNALAPLLAKHRLCMLPRVLDRQCVERRSTVGDALLSVALQVSFDIVSARDGSRHSVEVFAEAMDRGDKATNKAMAAAYKYAAVQAFCIPISGEGESDGDADRQSHRVVAQAVIAEPVEGWAQWVRGLSEVANKCATVEAIDRLQATYRTSLQALRGAAPSLYTELGTTLSSCRRALVTPLSVEAQPAEVVVPTSEKLNGTHVNEAARHDATS